MHKLLNLLYVNLQLTVMVVKEIQNVIIKL